MATEVVVTAAIRVYISESTESSYVYLLMDTKDDFHGLLRKAAADHSFVKKCQTVQGDFRMLLLKLSKAKQLWLLVFPFGKSSL